MIFSAETSGYQECLKLIDAFKEAGIDACISTGGVAVKCKPDQVNLAQVICTDLGAVFKQGYTGVQLNFLLKSKDGTDLAVRAKDDAQSVVNEWKK